MFWALTEGRYFQWTNTLAYFATKVEDEDEEVFCMKTSDPWKKNFFERKKEKKILFSIK
jgi:hypothetical protein